MLSIAAKGIWIEVLVHGHFSKNRGEVTGSPETLSRCFGCSVDELLSAVDEIESCGVGDVQRSGNLTQPNGNLTPPNSNLTITNRRMAREANAKQGNANRQKAWYDKHHPNKPLTPEKPLPSSPSSSSPSLEEKESLGRDSKKKSLGSDDPLMATLEWVILEWNKIDDVTPVAGTLHPKTRSRITARIREHPMKAWWSAEIFPRVRQSDFMCGRKNDWCASLGWACGPVNIQKILEDRYVGSKQAGGDRGRKNKVAIQQFLTGETT